MFVRISYICAVVMCFQLSGCLGKATSDASSSDQPNGSNARDADDDSPDDPAARLSVNFAVGEERQFVRISLADGKGQASVGQGDDIESKDFVATEEELERGRELFSADLIDAYDAASVDLEGIEGDVVLSRLVIARIGRRGAHTVLFDPDKTYGDPVEALIEYFEALSSRYGP